jgi:hypothetical protein
MLVYLDQALAQRKVAEQVENRAITLTELREAVIEGCCYGCGQNNDVTYNHCQLAVHIMYGTGTSSQVVQCMGHTRWSAA